MKFTIQCPKGQDHDRYSGETTPNSEAERIMSLVVAGSLGMCGCGGKLEVYRSGRCGCCLDDFEEAKIKDDLCGRCRTMDGCQGGPNKKEG